MIRIAHLSDIHFGRNFSKAAWDAIEDVVVEWEPDLIVVSGDLVDDPSPVHLLAAKGALCALSQRARDASCNGRVAELVVVPGNHDVFESGLAVFSRRPWFERIFHAETGRAESYVKETHKVDGFDTACLGFAPDARPQDAGFFAKAKAWFNAASAASDPSAVFSTLLPRVAAADVPCVHRPASPVLLALLDSNPTNPANPVMPHLYVATGEVDHDKLIGLQKALDKVEEHHVARIAVVHHHVVPIAFASDAHKMTGEPMMVLRNAGVVLRMLADYKFDLILHGHWHKSQFTRVDFGSDDQTSYPVAVVSAGSAAMHSPNDPRANAVNLIAISKTGRIEVKTVYYGAAQAPKPHGQPGQDYSLYTEPLIAAKRRAYIRARERHDIESETRGHAYEITENGDLWVEHSETGLSYSGAKTYQARPLRIYTPPQGHFVRETLQPGSQSVSDGFCLEPSDANSETESSAYRLKIPAGGLTRNGKPIDFTIRHGCANCIIMTRWEALQRVPPESRGAPSNVYDEEWIGTDVASPTGTLVLKVTFPPSLARVQPWVGCRCSPQYPHCRIDDWGDALLEGDLEVDGEVQAEEQNSLRFDASTRTWTLTVERPFVGYEYSIRWKVPGDAPNKGIEGRTREWQRVLLNLGERLDRSAPAANDARALHQFDLLCQTLEVELCKGGRDEKWVIALFVYDSNSPSLRPVLSRRSRPPAELPRDFAMAYGDGVSGAAFQQRRIISWNKDAGPPQRGDSLITPVPLPDPEGDNVEAIDIVNMLALPVHDSGMENLRHPPPWSVIGVVTIGSSSYASPIANLDDEELRRLRSAAQVQMNRIIEVLEGR